MLDETVTLVCNDGVERVFPDKDAAIEYTIDNLVVDGYLTRIGDMVKLTKLGLERAQQGRLL